MDLFGVSAITILTASFLGSLHCLGMCGGFVVYNTANSRNTVLANSLYNLGRLTTYLILGFLAGLLGYAINQSATFTGISHLASLLTGALLIIWGTSSFIKNKFPSNLNLSGAKSDDLIDTKTKEQSFLTKITSGINSFYVAILQNKFGLGENSRSYTLGLLSTLLPCGWLYSFVAMAAASGSPIKGTIIMFVFWLGTVPALIAAAFASKITIKPLQKYLPRITAAIIILAGFISIYSHVAMQFAAEAAHCH